MEIEQWGSGSMFIDLVLFLCMYKLSYATTLYSLLTCFIKRGSFSLNFTTRFGFSRICFATADFVGLLHLISLDALWIFEWPSSAFDLCTLFYTDGYRQFCKCPIFPFFPLYPLLFLRKFLVYFILACLLEVHCIQNTLFSHFLELLPF